MWPRWWAVIRWAAPTFWRRAMGKKNVEEMKRQRAVFVKGAGERGVKASVATEIFNLMEKFAGYGFNKSHAAAYSYVAYQTAYLKTALHVLLHGGQPLHGDGPERQDEGASG